MSAKIARLVKKHSKTKKTVGNVGNENIYMYVFVFISYYCIRKHVRKSVGNSRKFVGDGIFRFFCLNFLDVLNLSDNVNFRNQIFMEKIMWERSSKKNGKFKVVCIDYSGKVFFEANFKSAAEADEAGRDAQQRMVAAEIIKATELEPV